MNLTAEQIDIVIQHCTAYSIGGVDILAICDMAKRTAEAEADNLRLRKIASYVPGLEYIRAKERAGFGEKINAATQVKGGQPVGHTNPSLNNTPAVAAPDLVERLRVLSVTVPDVYADDIWPEDACKAMYEAAAALAERSERSD